ncbi:MAG: Fur family transcriptional regulator [Candidatus Sericytochromatia bacterium]
MEKLLPSCLTTKEIENLLKQKGIQPTAQRIAVCKYVLCEAEHTTVDEVKEWADNNFPKISLATVYNTLNVLVESGLIKALKLSHSDKVIYDNNTRNHYHFLDEATGKIYDIDPEQISLSYNLEPNFMINDCELIVKGTIKA